MGSIELTAADGHRLAAWKAAPQGTPKGAIVVVQEIFGINSHIRAVADGFASDGYLAIAPAFFDRVERGYETGYTPEDIAAGRERIGKLDWNNTLADLAAGIEAATEALGGNGKVGVVGYCWGGTVAWRAAARAQGLGASVCYYGGGIGDFVAEKPNVPVLLHFGAKDTTPSPETGKEIERRYPQAEVHVYPGAGHGFNCDQRGSYDAESAKLARTRTVAFFGKHLAR
ncbi:MAG: dienelactone hydrolase family protein [Burkholderiaceae bacterium]